MKKIFTFLFSSLLSLSLLAYDGSKLSISTVSNASDLRIEIDGRRVKMYENSITLTDIREGTHSVRILKDKARSRFGFGNRQEIIYAGSLFIRRGFQTDITISRLGKVYVEECRIEMNDDYNDDDFDNDGDWNNGYGNVMSTHDFELVKDQLRREWSEKNKLTSAKVIVDKSNFTTRQVNDLMLLFSFESNRLEIAKYAYTKTVDQQNYFQLNDALTFTSSKDELARFIRQSR